MATMNRIIFYSFILVTFSTSLHGSSVYLYKEMIKDVNNLERILKGVDPQLRVPAESDSGDLSCFVVELKRFSKMGGITKDVQRTIKRLIKKATSRNNSVSNCIAQEEQRLSNEVFLDQLLRILQKKFHQ